MRATTLVKFDATHQVKYNPPLMRAVHFTAKQFHNNRRLLFHSPQGEFHRKKVFVKMTKTFFLVEMAGIEPASENRLPGLSTSVAALLTFPPRTAEQQALRISSL